MYCRLAHYRLQAWSAVLLVRAAPRHYATRYKDGAPLSAYATVNQLCMYFIILGFKLGLNVEMLLPYAPRLYAWYADMCL